MPDFTVYASSPVRAADPQVLLPPAPPRFGWWADDRPAADRARPKVTDADADSPFRPSSAPAAGWDEDRAVRGPNRQTQSRRGAGEGLLPVPAAVPTTAGWWVGPTAVPGSRPSPRHRRRDDGVLGPVAPPPPPPPVPRGWEDPGDRVRLRWRLSVGSEALVLFDVPPPRTFPPGGRAAAAQVHVPGPAAATVYVHGAARSGVYVHGSAAGEVT